MTIALPLGVLPFAAAALLGSSVLLPAAANAQGSLSPVTITIEVALPPEAHSTPRDWYFEITDTTGAVADAVTVSTTAQSPAGSVTRTLPAGTYRVDYLFSDQVARSCGETAFFALAGPVNATASVTADGSTMDFRYEFEACPSSPLPLGSVVQETSAVPLAGPEPAPAVSSSAMQSAPPAADAGPSLGAAPLPPDTGSGLAATTDADEVASLWSVAVAFMAAFMGVSTRAFNRQQ